MTDSGRKEGIELLEQLKKFWFKISSFLCEKNFTFEGVANLACCAGIEDFMHRLRIKLLLNLDSQAPPKKERLILRRK